MPQHWGFADFSPLPCFLLALYFQLKSLSWPTFPICPLKCLPIYLWSLLSNLLSSHIPSHCSQHHDWFSAPRPSASFTPTFQSVPPPSLPIYLLPSVPNIPGLCQVFRKSCYRNVKMIELPGSIFHPNWRLGPEEDPGRLLTVISKGWVQKTHEWQMLDFLPVGQNGGLRVNNYVIMINYVNLR